jgi:5,10-methylenetetrahydromethanopterin reductase
MSGGTTTGSPSYGIALFPSAEPEEFVRLARIVDANPAFDTLWVPDERFFRDMTVLLTLAGVHTSRVRIGPAVTDPFVRHPALTAAIMATIAEVSHGRLVTGIGAGISGFTAMGVVQERPQVVMREAMTLMRSLWAGDKVDLDGRTVRFHGSLDFEPLYPRIPIWVAGRGPAVLRLGGEIADGVLIGGLASRRGLDYAYARIDEGIAKSGRTDRPTRALWLHTAVADDPEAAREAVRKIVVGVLISSRGIIAELGLPIPRSLMAALQGVTYGVNNPEVQRVAAMIDDDVLQHFAVAGTPEEVGRRTRELSAMGIDHVAVVPWLAEGQTADQFLEGLSAAAQVGAAASI